MGHADRNARAAIIAQDIGRAVDRPYGEAACGDQKRITAYNYFTEITPITKPCSSRPANLSGSHGGVATMWRTEVTR